MVVETRFKQVVRSLEELREAFGEPSERSRDKVLTELDEHCRRFVQHSPFVLIGTAGTNGWCDVSPKGDEPGFVRILDDRTLLIPDRPGNRRFDSFRNLFENPHIGLLFLIPNAQDTLRINGRATIIRDEDVLETMAARGKRPALGIVVEVEEAFLHCPKAFIRSSLWDAARAADARPVASFARMLMDHARLEGVTEEEVQRSIDENIKNNL
jgi:PPOX class probable FMN-dependent enzyme